MAEDALIRLENLRGMKLSAKELESAVGGRYTYWRDLLAGNKSFGEKIARKIEEKLGLARGSLDTDQKNRKKSSWPFPGIERARFDGLTHDQKIEIQGLVRIRIEKFESGPQGGPLDGQSAMDELRRRIAENRQPTARKKGGKDAA